MEFYFPPNYPEDIPFVKEVDYKIPDTFHRFGNGGLCLGTPSEQWLIFNEDPTLNNYIIKLVNPYLLSWLWYQRFNEMPWGEQKHGYKGLIDSYQNLLKIKTPRQTIYFMKRVLFDRIDRMDDCPCGSGKTYKKCHYKIYINLTNRLQRDQLLNDYKYIFKEIIL